MMRITHNFAIDRLRRLSREISYEDLPEDEWAVGDSVEQYIARFVVHNIGYQIQATGLTGEQFLAVLSAVIAD